MRLKESNAIYHDEKEHISSTRLKIYAKSPMHYKYDRDNPEPSEPMGCLDFGNATHSMIFEPETFYDNTLILDLDSKPEPDKTFASTKNKEWKQKKIDFARIAKAPLIDSEQLKVITDMKEVLYADPYIRDHLTDPSGVAERSYYVDYPIPGTDYVVKVKVRPDWETDSAIFDYKSAKDADFYGFNKAISSLMYNVSAAMYREVVRIETGLLKPFFWIAQEKTAPYAPALYMASEEDLRKGLSKFIQLLTTHAMCQEAGFYPGYTAFGTIRKGFKFNGAQVSNTKWDNEALSLASGVISDENIEVKRQ